MPAEIRVPVDSIGNWFDGPAATKYPTKEQQLDHATTPTPGHQIYPYLLRNLAVVIAEGKWALEGCSTIARRSLWQQCVSSSNGLSFQGRGRKCYKTASRILRRHTRQPPEHEDRLP